eukprot:2285811-Pyramimonas_sp.AAC.2
MNLPAVQARLRPRRRRGMHPDKIRCEELTSRPGEAQAAGTEGAAQPAAGVVTLEIGASAAKDTRWLGASPRRHDPTIQSSAKHRRKNPWGNHRGQPLGMLQKLPRAVAG